MTANDYISDGQEWTDRIARLVLPILLWVAKNGKTITYKKLAEELQSRHNEDIKRRMTLYGLPAGKIGDALIQLSDEWGKEVPPINALIVNAQTGLPGKGVDLYIKRFISREYRENMTDSNRDALAQTVIEGVWHYAYWDRVAEYFEISEKNVLPVKELVGRKKDDDPIEIPKELKLQGGGGGQSQEHANLKCWAAKNPKFFSRFGNFEEGENEYPLYSGDSVDAYLDNKEQCLAIEAKASNAPDSELFRGVFQCVKYRATLRAMQLAEGRLTNAQAVLLTTRKNIPNEVLRLAKRLSVVVMTALLEAESACS